MSDTGMQVTAEDRERLAKSKFGEWFDEFFEKKFEESFKKASAGATPRGEQRKAAEGAGDGQQQQQDGPAPRRRSLLETCLSDTFGF
jgi:hypothetical protein